jgi:short-subunit dehydrogenase
MADLPPVSHVAIFGATSAIAAEVAEAFARRGARLFLVGRNPLKLVAVAARCGGAVVATRAADFEAQGENEAVVAAAFGALGRVDVALVAHGDLGDQLASERSFDEAERTLRVNFTSAVSLLIPLANRLEAQRSGRLAVLSSVAGERGRPRNYTYGAAKGALTVYLQGLRTRLAAAGVSVTTVKLGPVDTPMTAGHAKHPLFGKPPAVAAGIVRAIDARVGEAYVPAFWRLIMPLVKAVPERLFQRLPFLSGR